jgi:glycosyltransferase involved in cell wall biosynthesis
MPGHPVSVILNDRCLRNAQTGVGRYVTELLAALPKVDPGIDILAFYRTYLARGNSNDPKAPAGAPAGGSPRRSPDWLRRLLQGGYELAFEAAGTLRGYRLYHEPNHIPGPWNGPVVTTIHDLSVLRHPDWHPADRVRWYERELLASLPRSAHFITVSEFTRQEMIALLGISPERITAIPLGARAAFVPRPAAEVCAWLAEHGLPAEYLLFVGTMEPRKNVPGLLAAYAGLSDAQRARFPLLMAGAGGWGMQPLEDEIEATGLTGQVHMLGYVPDEDLCWLYAGARALVWPTFYEGFGLPPLECMATGTPVITSHVASLPEVVGDAGLLVEARDTDGFTEALRQVIEDDKLAADLAQRGLARSEAFSWERCAAEHADIYRRCAS